MFIENNLRKKKPEGTFTDPEKEALKPIYVAPVVVEEVYEEFIMDHWMQEGPAQMKSPIPNTPPIVQTYTKGGFGIIR